MNMCVARIDLLSEITAGWLGSKQFILLHGRWHMTICSTEIAAPNCVGAACYWNILSCYDSGDSTLTVVQKPSDEGNSVVSEGIQIDQVHSVEEDERMR